MTRLGTAIKRADGSIVLKGLIGIILRVVALNGTRPEFSAGQRGTT